MKIDYSQPKIITRTVLLTAIILAIIISLLTGCSGTYYVVDTQTHDHATEIYYHNDLPYWGMYNNYYYYYGIPHIYPWWYYYTMMPVYTYSIQTHVHITLDRGNVVRGPRGPKFNNRNERTYTPNKGIVNKPVRTIKNNNNRVNVKTNSNKVNIRTNNKSNIKTNTNRTNIRTNNNKTRTRTNKTVKTNKRSPR